MKVLLIRPPENNLIPTNVLKFVDKSIGCYPPLGLMYIAAIVMQNTDFEVLIIDAVAEKLIYQELRERIKQEEPDIVGITATSFTLIDALFVAKMVKDVNRNICVCLGGPHVSIYPQETVQFPYVDFVVVGEGEYAFLELLKSIEKNVESENIIYGEFIENLDDLPFPDRRLLPIKKYYSLISKVSPVTTMITSRGCPFKCIFCDRPTMGKRFRARSAGNVVKEFEECKNMGIKEIFVYDDTFTFDRKRVIEICKGLEQRKIKISWDIRTRVDVLDRDVLYQLKKAGCKRIHLGIESGSAKILKVLRKGTNLKKAVEIIKIAKDLHIETLAYFMIGNPTETYYQIQETIEFAVKLGADYVHFAVTTPFPGTPLYKKGLSEGVWDKDYWREFAKNPRRDFVPEIWKENFTRDELEKLLKYAYKRFYFRMDYISKELLSIRNFVELGRKLKAGFQLLFT